MDSETESADRFRANENDSHGRTLAWIDSIHVRDPSTKAGSLQRETLFAFPQRNEQTNPKAIDWVEDHGSVALRLRIAPLPLIPTPHQEQERGHRLYPSFQRRVAESLSHGTLLFAHAQ
jgi:hypothetical protein